MNKKFHDRTIKCATGEIAKGYNAYLNTKHWKDLRIEVAKESDYKCIRCSGIFKDNFSIHHNTYKRLGHEQLKDLSFYCSRCHTVIHNDRKNTKAFNRQYSSLIASKMKKLSEDEIWEVLDFMDNINKKKPANIRYEKTKKRKLKKKLKKSIEREINKELNKILL